MKIKFYIIGPRLNHITDNTTLQFSILCLVIGSLAGTKVSIQDTLTLIPLVQLSFSADILLS